MTQLTYTHARILFIMLYETFIGFLWVYRKFSWLIYTLNTVYSCMGTISIFRIPFPFITFPNTPMSVRKKYRFSSNKLVNFRICVIWLRISLGLVIIFLEPFCICMPSIHNTGFQYAHHYNYFRLRAHTELKWIPQFLPIIRHVLNS